MTRHTKPQLDRARKQQLLVGLIVGVIVGVLVSLMSQFWLWLPAGVIFGTVVGAFTKPPQTKD